MTAAGNVNLLWQIAVTIHGNHHLASLLRRPGGIEAWNRLVGRLAERNLLGTVWGPGDEPPIVVALDLSRAVLPRRLIGIDLTFAWLGEGIDLSGRQLQGAKIGCCPGADLSGSDITGATFLGDISGADFSGCIVSGETNFRNASFSKQEPPRGLVLIDQPKADDWATPPAGRPGRLPWVRLRADVNLLDLAPFVTQEPDGSAPH